jgi:NAD(P)H-hydrate epimerase
VSIGRRAALTAAEARALDRALAQRLALPSLLLMENAGRGAAEEIHRRCQGECRGPGDSSDSWGGPRGGGPEAPLAVILCGPGNNGGDGFVVARHLHRLGWCVRAVDAAPDRPQTGDAAVMQQIASRLATGGDGTFELRAISRNDEAEQAVAAIPTTAVVVDALLGTGACGEPRGTVAALLSALAARRDAARLRVALDLPSGLDADSGQAAIAAFRADLTLTFAAEKRGLRRGEGPELCGERVVVDLGVRGDSALAQLPPRPPPDAGDPSGVSVRPRSPG